MAELVEGAAPPRRKAEGCQSGRMGRTRNAVSAQVDREFESHSLRFLAGSRKSRKAEMSSRVRIPASPHFKTMAKIAKALAF